MSKIALQGNDAGTGTLTLQAPVTNLNRNLVLPDVDGTLSTAEQVKLPIGSFMWFTGTVAPEAFIVADGELRSRAAFPDLWAFAQASGNISVDDASWTFGQYSPGDGSTTFRVPKVDDRFIRGKSATRSVGLVEEDAFQGHEHAIQPLAAAGGAINGIATNYFGSYSARTSTPAGSSNVVGPTTDGTNGTPRTADETRPKALTMLPCIKAYDVISDPSVLNAVAVVNEISRLESEKLRKDDNINLGVSVPASGTAVDFVGIPEGVKRITVMFYFVSLSGSSHINIRIGSASLKTTNYYGASAVVAGTSAASLQSVTGIPVYLNNSVRNFFGAVTFEKNKDHVYVASVNGRSAEDMAVMGGGAVMLDGEAQSLRVTTVNGTDQFDSGTINISWEF